MMNEIHMAGPWITEHEMRTVNDAMQNWYDDCYWYCEAFEREFAAYHDRRHALMTSNCTSAIHLVLAALGVGRGDEVIVPECTWIASAAPISQLGARPVFCDIDPHTWTLSPDSVQQAITSKTKAIIAVDLYGNMPAMERLGEIAREHEIPLIEDAAEALGSTYKGVKAGKFGIASVFSFHRTKTLTTGEGGMLVTDDPDLFERCGILRDHGRRKGGPMYYNEEVAYKYMPFNVQAALGYAQLQRVEELVEKKRWIYNAYKEGLSDIEDLHVNPEPPDGRNGVWITALVFGESHGLDKDEAMKRLRDVHVPSRPFFYPLSSIPAYDKLRSDEQTRNPVAYDVASRGINLPGALNMTEDQVAHVCAGVRKILSKS